MMNSLTTLPVQQHAHKPTRNLEEYKNSLQGVIDGWAILRTAVSIANPTGQVGTRDELFRATNAYIESNQSLDPRDFPLMYQLLCKKGYPLEVIENIFGYFERGAKLSELAAAYKEQA